MMTIRHVIGRITRRRKVPVQRLYAGIPHLLTLANACAGFFSVLYALEGNIVQAAYCIIIAALFDMLDGRIARYLASESYMGTELDSLCDAVSFCVAPAVLLHAYVSQHGIIAAVMLSLYLCAGLFRLARFNAQAVHTVPYFKGLPTTMAACFLASIIMHHAWLQTTWLAPIASAQGIMICALVCAFLMVSSLPFPSAKKYTLRHRNGVIVSLLCVIFCIVCTIRHYPLIFIGCCSYMVYASFYTIQQLLIGRRSEK